MSQNLFQPEVIGNLCKDCCDCKGIIWEPDVKCCTVNGVKKCYNPKKDCQECIGTAPNQTLRKYCEEGDNLLKGKTSCCNGECFCNTCDKCQNKKTIKDYNPEKEGCCCKGGKFKLKTCFFCNQNDEKTSTCTEDMSICCDGECIKSENNPCEKCNKESDEIGVIEKTCNSDDLPDCCGGTCWNQNKDKCQMCDTVNGKLVKKQDCEFCCEYQGTKNCCKKNEKCCPRGTCVSECEECTQ